MPHVQHLHGGIKADGELRKREECLWVLLAHGYMSSKGLSLGSAIPILMLKCYHTSMGEQQGAPQLWGAA